VTWPSLLVKIRTDGMKPKFQCVPAAERAAIVEARDACTADPNENRIDLVVGGRLVYTSIFCSIRNMGT
jgi:hypothetical protein